MLALVAAAGALGCASPPRLVDQDPATGFAIYRSGWLSRSDLAMLCAAGVEELVVLDGTATKRECRMRAAVCPGLRIRYNERQDARVPVDEGFLAAFDAWVESSRQAGRKIAYRCRHGWHRAGRLTAWYRMRFNGATAEEAIVEMLEAGRFMDRHEQLVPQVEAMADHLADRDCAREKKHCVREADAAGSGSAATFAAGTCPPAS